MFIKNISWLCLLFNVMSNTSQAEENSTNTPLHAALPASFTLHSRIVGGVPTTIEEHPYQAAVDIFTSEGRFICGGSIISPIWILTAAHCVYDSPTKVLVRVGSTNFDSGKSINVNNLAIHPFYDPSSSDKDIAVLLLGEPLRLNGQTIASIKLADEEPLPSTPITVTGWGTTSEGGSTSDTLMEVTIPVVSRKICNRQYTYHITHNMLCAGLLKGGRDSCQGDSGGPAITDDGILVGVVSFGEGCARRGYPGIYANVAAPALRGWISYVTGV